MHFYMTSRKILQTYKILNFTGSRDLDGRIYDTIQHLLKATSDSAVLFFFIVESLNSTTYQVKII